MSTDDQTIRNLLQRYCELQDAADFAGVSELFRHATYRVYNGPSLRGYDEVYAMKTHHDQMHADGTLRTKHVTTNTIVDVAAHGATASARSYFVVFQATSTLPLQAVIAGRYLDELEKVDATWRFVDRCIHGDLVGDLTQHIRDNPLDAAGPSSTKAVLPVT